MKMSVEIGTMQTQGKEWPEPQEAGRGEEGFFLEPWGNSGPGHTLILNSWPPEL